MSQDEMKYFWKAKSGEFAGIKRGQAFYNANGEHVGIFVGEVLHSNRTGDVIAKIVFSDYLGKYTAGGRIGIYRYANTGRTPIAGRGGSGSGYDDPDLSGDI